jgi:ribokinase
MAKPIVVVGSINIDLVAASERIPAPGETISGKTFHTFFGGKGANQAVAIARLGHPVCMVGKVGDDVFGAELNQALQAAGVDTRPVQKIPGASGVALINTDAHGENSIVVVPGANGEVLPTDIDRHAGLLRTAGMILTQLEIPFETVEYLAEFASTHGIPLMLDPAPARELPESLLRRVSWITPNETEIAQLLAETISDEGQLAERLAVLGAENVLLKLGGRGVVLKEGRNTPRLISGFSVDAVDTTGAGDAFNGAFAVAFLSGKPPRESAEFANAAAAISVTRPGAQASMPVRSEVETFLRERRTSREVEPALRGK